MVETKCGFRFLAKVETLCLAPPFWIYRLLRGLLGNFTGAILSSCFFAFWIIVFTTSVFPTPAWPVINRLCLLSANLTVWVLSRLYL